MNLIFTLSRCKVGMLGLQFNMYTYSLFVMAHGNYIFMKSVRKHEILDIKGLTHLFLFLKKVCPKFDLCHETIFLNFCSRVLITTDVWARGLDVQQVSLVINYDLPNNRELYIHRYCSYLNQSYLAQKKNNILLRRHPWIILGGYGVTPDLRSAGCLFTLLFPENIHIHGWEYFQWMCLFGLWPLPYFLT